MMLIPARILPSEIHGKGLFATSTIPEGTVIWRYNDPPDYRIPLSIWLQYAKLPKWDGFRKYGYHFPGTDYLEFCGDGAMFINHSFMPNVRCSGTEEMFTSRIIPNGEEITVDYREIDTEAEDEEMGLERLERSLPTHRF